MKELLWIGLLIAPLGGCATLAAWERGIQQSAVMDPAPSLLEAGLDDHLNTIREAAQGATGSAGSACGCT